MISTILQSFRVAEIRNKLLFTAAILALYRLGSFIPVPGVDVKAIEEIQQNYSSGILSLLNQFLLFAAALTATSTRGPVTDLAAATPAAAPQPTPRTSAIRHRRVIRRRARISRKTQGARRTRPRH